MEAAINQRRGVLAESEVAAVAVFLAGGLVGEKRVVNDVPMYAGENLPLARAAPAFPVNGPLERIGGAAYDILRI